MSQENVEIVNLSTELWNAGDLDGIRGLFHPDAVLHVPEGFPEQGPFVGVDEVINQFRRMGEGFSQHQAETTDIEASRDYVIVQHRTTLRGEHSGMEAKLRYAGVYRFRAGKIVEVRYYWDHTEALEAVGLSE